MTSTTASSSTSPSAPSPGAVPYDPFGVELPAEAERGMVEWATEHRQGEHGRHTYSLADFGLDRGALDERFARYFMRHDVEREPASQNPPQQEALRSGGADMAVAAEETTRWNSPVQNIALE